MAASKHRVGSLGSSRFQGQISQLTQYLLPCLLRSSPQKSPLRLPIGQELRTSTKASPDSGGGVIDPTCRSEDCQKVGEDVFRSLQRFLSLVPAPPAKPFTYSPDKGSKDLGVSQRKLLTLNARAIFSA